MLICLGSKYLLICHKDYMRNDFVSASKVERGSWAEDFANRMFDCLMGNTVNLKEEYEYFYKAEYQSFDVFLAKTYGFDKSTLENIRNKMTSNDILLFGDLGSEGDYSTAQLIEFSDEIVNSINRILNSGERNENQSRICNQ